MKLVIGDRYFVTPTLTLPRCVPPVYGGGSGSIQLMIVGYLDMGYPVILADFLLQYTVIW